MRGCAPARPGPRAHRGASRRPRRRTPIPTRSAGGRRPIRSRPGPRTSSPAPPGGRAGPWRRVRSATASSAGSAARRTLPAPCRAAIPGSRARRRRTVHCSPAGAAVRRAPPGRCRRCPRSAAPNGTRRPAVSPSRRRPPRRPPASGRRPAAGRACQCAAPSERSVPARTLATSSLVTRPPGLPQLLSV